MSVPYLMHCGIPLHRAIGTSAALGFPIALAGSATYVALGLDRINLPPGSLGLIYLPAVIGISLTSVPFAPLGASLAHRWPTKRLRTLFAILVALGGMKLLYQGLQRL
ncbi:MAG: sulfite exporter TauE/SafE family protein [Gammaproteobacteria bacterium]|nr:sulfite exporter TauE/SafE family protein [Gammaproteobacteria bacterium]